MPAKMALASTSTKSGFIDIAVNLTDPVFRGNYHGKQAHPDDFDSMMARARTAGVCHQIVTGGSLQESKEALELCRSYPDLTSTCGCHPTRAGEFDAYEGGPKAYLTALDQLLQDNAVTIHGKGKGKAVAVGECGLDYDRLHFAPKEVQQRHFASQLALAEKFKLPLFLHSRNAAKDLADILRPRIQELAKAIRSSGEGRGHAPPRLSDDAQGHAASSEALPVGVVHSFTGTLDELKELVEMGLFIGVNGCSLKTEENLAVVKEIPLDRLLLETDSPWCEPRPTHASASFIKQFIDSDEGLKSMYNPSSVKKEKHSTDKMVKSRNEPCVIGQVAAVVAGVKGLDIKTVAEAAERNTRWLFDL